MHLTVRLGADRDGTLRAVDIRCLADTGAYGEHAFTVFAAVSQKTLPLYGRARPAATTVTRSTPTAPRPAPCAATAPPRAPLPWNRP